MKAKEAAEIIKGIEEVRGSLPEDGLLVEEALNMAIKALELFGISEQLPSAQPEQRWIPCSERLPDEGYVLISKKPKKYFDGWRCVTIAIRMEDPRSRKVNWRDIGFGVIPDDNVLAWMPLPEPYEERRTDETD